MSENDKFRELFQRYICLKRICENARERVSNPGDKYAQKIEIPLSGKKAVNRKREVAKYFDALYFKIDELFFLDIVAHFEQIVFNEINNASGQLKGIVKERYRKPAPFNKIVASFVKDEEDIYSLKNVYNLLENHIPKSLSEQLSAIIEHRNFIAHGGRIGKQSNNSVENTVTILSEILRRI
ncbi:MAG: hypothetical protein DRI57_10650 [Deltaproteobacteria bacterium]|nr:MAG: hypothetical protein DRI57_10650 [Deltaproteobacteria bacterium]